MLNLFSCSHENLTLVVTIQKKTYRRCLDCGARQLFDLDSFSSIGDFQVESPEEGTSIAS